MDDKEKANLSPTNQKVHPRKRANLLSNIFFCWSVPFFIKGFKKNLTEEDLYGALPEHESKTLGNQLENAWMNQINSGASPSLWKALISVCWKEYTLYILPAIAVECGFKMLQPLFVGKLMEYYIPNQTIMTKETAYLYAGGIALMSFLCVLVSHNYYLSLQQTAMKLRIANCSLIYRKSLRLSKAALAETTIGQMVNLLSNDVNRFNMGFGGLINLLIVPTQTLIIMYVLYKNHGLISLTGLLVFLLFIPLQMYLAKRISVNRLRTALKTDHRVRLMNEIICGIQVIKMYAWEKPFAKLVDMARKSEIQHIKANSYILAITMSFRIFLNRLAVFFFILVYVLTGNTVQSEYVYVVMSYYGIVRQSITALLPMAINFLAQVNVSVKRIQKFLLLDEIERENKSSQPNGTVALSENDVGIHIVDGSAKWLSASTEESLSDINLNVSLGQLVAIVGPVGSGKTTLIHVILKELPLIKGSLNVNGTISYASQEPWLFGASVRQNILFGETYDAKRYNEVVKVCALKRDFSLFPYGDRTIVGERGAMLSGGQRARINLARAIYKDADIYLLDDPLSAVDTHVGKQLFDDCITSYLRNKCVVLVTHQLQYLRSVNKIYLLENGKVTIGGTYDELKQSDEEFLKLLEGETDDKEEKKKTIERKARNSLIEESDEQPTEVEEHISRGTISKKVYKSYMKASGNIFVSFFIILLFVVAQVAGTITDYFLTFWMNLEQSRREDNLTDVSNNITDVEKEFEEIFFTPDNCLYLYSALVAFLIFIALTRSLSFFKTCMRASRNLHNRMFSSVVFTSMRFFNTNSSGRILNRFSKDIGSIDEVLPMAILDTIQIGLVVLSINILVASVNPIIILPTIVILGLFYILRVIYLATSRDVKRMEGTTRSPVFTHIIASLQGLTTIRAFGAEKVLRDDFDKHQDLHSSAYYMFIGCNSTFGFWLDMQSVIYITIVTLSFLFMGNEKYGGNVGLGITQCITLTGMLQWGMRQWSELENQMTSVERVVEYTEIEPEPDDVTKKPHHLWPYNGEVEFKSVSMSYASDLPLVLKNLNFKVNSGEKVGIVGRTGAGKSSLISVLFRLANIEGEIVIDDVDTKTISLHSLRSKISIIPQEPVLFSGTLRYNLDPFDEYDDDQLWGALEEVELKTVFSDLGSGLETVISEGGSNFSVGQRQLLCLARAIIRDNKILILDEATANVDPQTDELIQATIRRKFKDCTVLTIAHRLHTVMDSDKILVMDAGQVAAFDHPHLLLRDTSSIFYGLVQQTGKGMAENLTKIAEESFNLKDVSTK